MSTVLDLGSCIGSEADVPLKLLRSSVRTKTFEKTSLACKTDGSKEKGITAIGFIICDVNGSELVC